MKKHLEILHAHAKKAHEHLRKPVKSHHYAIAICGLMLRSSIVVYTNSGFAKQSLQPSDEFQPKVSLPAVIHTFTGDYTGKDSMSNSSQNAIPVSQEPKIEQIPTVRPIIAEPVKEDPANVQPVKANPVNVKSEETLPVKGNTIEGHNTDSVRYTEVVKDQSQNITKGKQSIASKAALIKARLKQNVKSSKNALSQVNPILSRVAPDQFLSDESTIFPINPIPQIWLSVGRSDWLGAIVHTTYNAQNMMFYGIKVVNLLKQKVKIKSITLTPSNPSFNNGISVKLKHESEVIAAEKILNGATTFKTDIIVTKGTPVNLKFEGDFLSTIAGGQTSTFAVSFNTGDVVNVVTSNNVTVNGTPATSAIVHIAAGGSVIVTPNTAPTDKWFIAPGEERKIGSIHIQAINDSLMLKALYIKIKGVGAFAEHAGNQLSNFKIKDADGNVIATESTRDTQINTNDIVKFTSFSANPTIAVGTSKVFNIYATTNTVNDSTHVGQFNIALATSYNDPSYTDEYKWMRLMSINAGNYISSNSSPVPAITTANIGNTLYTASAYPKISKVADGNNTDLITVRIYNPGSTNLTVNGLLYFANAQVSSDIAKPAKIFNGWTEIAAATLAANMNNTPITFNAPITIAGGEFTTLLVKLNSPFVNTAATPVAGNRVFQVSNILYSQTFANGSTSTFGFVPAWYTSAIGFPASATY